MVEQFLSGCASGASTLVNVGVVDDGGNSVASDDLLIDRDFVPEPESEERTGLPGARQRSRRPAALTGAAFPQPLPPASDAPPPAVVPAGRASGSGDASGSGSASSAPPPAAAVGPQSIDYCRADYQRKLQTSLVQLSS